MKKECKCNGNCNGKCSCNSCKDDMKTRQEIRLKVTKIQETIKRCLKLITPKKEEEKV